MFGKMIKATALFVLAFFAFAYAQSDVCIPPAVDDFYVVNSWSDGATNYTQWKYYINGFNNETTYYNVRFKAVFLEDATLVDIWNVDAVAGMANTFQYPAWARQWGVRSDVKFEFGYITNKNYPVVFNLVDFTCTPSN
eukprot:TRINITY_DN29156_c0_g1_i1.p1 TRINITY_DN29156_c0_g1~~TRINITY_DN29156_c0_g1_i1.p1  ORF type:complete len:138 (+),score=60.09 TRINITY_DN29156_c0_g1_i1:65-478(+)